MPPVRDSHYPEKVKRLGEPSAKCNLVESSTPLQAGVV
jgi:hypothetical protein